MALELPSYCIEYAKKGENFKWKLIKNSPKTINAILTEKKLIKNGLKNTNSTASFQTIDWAFTAKNFLCFYYPSTYRFIGQNDVDFE